MKIITALLALNLFCGSVYHLTVVKELRSDLTVEQELFKACTAELMWFQVQLNEVSL